MKKLILGFILAFISITINAQIGAFYDTEKELKQRYPNAVREVNDGFVYYHCYIAPKEVLFHFFENTVKVITYMYHNDYDAGVYLKFLNANYIETKWNIWVTHIYGSTYMQVELSFIEDTAYFVHTLIHK